MGQRLDQLEKDVLAKQDLTTECMVKKLKKDRDYEFKRKGNERQFLFNNELKDWIEAAPTHLAKLKPTKEQETALKAVNEEIQEGAKAIYAWQKLICIVDHSKLGWQVVEAYKSDELTSDNEEAKCLKKTQKCTEQKDLKNKRKRISAQGGSRGAYRWCGQSIAPEGANQYSSQGNFNPIQTSLVPS